MAGRTVTIELGGKERNLRYTLNSIAAIGEKLGIKLRIGHVEEDLLGIPVTLDFVRVVLWAGLMHEDKDLTPEQVGEWVDLENMGYVVERFLGLFGSKWQGMAQALVNGQAASPTGQSSEG